MRVQIPAYTDRWLMGDRYGEVVKITAYKPNDAGFQIKELAHVQLDISGKTIRVFLDDCTVVS